MKTIRKIRILTYITVLLIAVYNNTKAQLPSNNIAALCNYDPNILIHGRDRNDSVQSNCSADNLTLNDKMNKYFGVMKKADIYETKAETQLQEVYYLRLQSHYYIDSTRYTLRKAKRDFSKTSIYIKKLNFFIEITSSFAMKVDSVIRVANAFKDSAVAETKEAEAICLTFSSDIKIIPANTTSIFNYVVQLGAGDMSQSYFKKVEGIKIIKPSDGLKRYVLGPFNTKEEAISIKEKMVLLGYADAFIRTLDSLYK
jgi:hypothetical protein